jgi:hypothetical protein
MKVGDLVRSLRFSRGVGIVVRSYNDPFGLVLIVRWPNGNTHKHVRGALQIVEEK